MSQQPSPPVPPSPGPPGAAYARPGRPRPRRAWFALGAVLLVLAATVFVVGLLTTLGRATQTDVVALLRGPGQPVGAGVPVDEERMLFVPQGEAVPSCTVTDALGNELPQRPATVSSTVRAEGTTWTGVSTFTSPTEAIQVECAAPVQRLRIGSPLGSGFALGVLLTVLLPLVLGLAGVAVLVTTTVLWFTRAPAPGPGPAAGGPPRPWTPPPGR